MITLTDKQKFQVIYGKETITIDGTKYYVKYSDFPIMEFVGEELAKRLGITCAHYDTAMINDTVYLLSPDLSIDGLKFKSAQDLGIYGNSLYSIWDYLEHNKVSNVQEIMDKVLKIYYFDVLLRPGDRHSGNWGFMLKDDVIVDVCILDNELLFSSDTTHMNTSLDDEKNLFDINEVPTIPDFFTFLKESGNKYLEDFKKVYKELDPDVILDLIIKIDTNENLNSKGIEVTYMEYMQHYLEIGKLISSRGLK